ncbi:protoporphyrinogen oxidase [candidate division KSB1 bacterium]
MTQAKTDTKDITIIGGGISGLATAFWLKQENFNVLVLEKGSDTGGTMETVTEHGFLFDRGPNSGLDTNPHIRTLVEQAGLADEMIYADKTARKRYILRDNTLHPLPMSPSAFIQSGLFSKKAKLRVMMEPLIRRSKEGDYQTVADFVKRRLGKEFLDYAINPFVSGVFAGVPEQLSVRSAFPKLYRLEEVYGGLIKGMIKGAKERKNRPEKSKQTAQMFSFRHGMQILPRTLAEKLKDDVVLNADVTEIQRNDSGYTVHYTLDGNQETHHTNAVLTTIPAYKLAAIAGGLDAELAEHLNAIYYPPVLLVLAGYKLRDIGQPLDGFGFLIPAVEQKTFLGAIWSSTIFPGRSPEDCAAFTLFIGGARQPELLSGGHDTVIEKALEEFQELMQIDVKPVYIANRFWEKAIPQYTPGYIEHIRCFEQFEESHPGFFIGGNFRGGISVSDCIGNSRKTCEKIKTFLSRDSK